MQDVHVPGLVFDDVTVERAGVTVLDHLTLAVPGSGLTCVAGPSGSGKSTLLRLANRLDVPTRGRVLLDGRDIAEVDPLRLRRQVGMVFQRPVTFAGTVRDNLLVACSRRDRRTDAGQDLELVLARVGLPRPLLHRQADDLSGGEAQRLCIARALLTGPRALLMDEPTSALDVDARTVVEDLARELVDGDITVVWVTHDLEQAARIGDRTVVIREGRLVPEDEAARYLAERTFRDGNGSAATGEASR